MKTITQAIDKLEMDVIRTSHSKYTNSAYRLIRALSLISILVTLIWSFIFPVSLFQGFIITPILLLLLISLCGFADAKLEALSDANQQAAQVYCFIEKYYSKLDKDAPVIGQKAA
jgi:hypothetical protein